MRTNQMAGVTLAAFIIAYIDVISRFVNWTNGGGMLVPIISLVLVVSANFRQNWARVIWTFLKCAGVVVVVGYLFTGVIDLGPAFFSIILFVIEMICLWHPKTSDWMSKE